MPLNAQEFILPGFGGGDPAAGLTNLSNKMWMRNMQTQRLELAKEGKRQQAGSFLRQYLDTKDYLTGTAYDPVINANIQQAMKHGSELAEQGADIPQLLTQLAPMMQQVTQYSATAKAVNKQIDDQIKTMRESGAVGYDFGKLKDIALKSAFHNIDPKTGQDLGLNSIDKVDPSVNYAMKALQDHPDQITTGEGLDQYVKNYPQYKNSTDATTYTPTGTKTRNKVNMIGQAYLTPELDDQGVVTGLVPKYDHATDGGEPLLHEFTNNQGQKVKAPVRLLDEGYFNEATSHKYVGDWLRGQVKQHLQDYTDQTGKPIDMNSAQAHQVARAIMYDELKRRSPGSIQFSEELNKPSAQQVQLRLFGDKRQQSYDRTMGRYDAMEAEGIDPTKSVKPLNNIETIHQIFKGDPDYLTGPVVNKNGHSVIDVTANFKGGLFRYAHGATGTYNNIYFDPERRVLMSEESDGKIEEHPEASLKPWAKSIAAANNINVGTVDKSFEKGGYGKNAYTTPASTGAIDYVKTEAAKQHQEKLTKGINEVVDSDDGSRLEGMKISEGEILKAGQSSMFAPGKYYLDVKSPTGTTKRIRFGNKEEMQKYINGEATTPKPTTPKTEGAKAPTKDTGKKLSKEQEDALKEVGL